MMEILSCDDMPRDEGVMSCKDMIVKSESCPVKTCLEKHFYHVNTVISCKYMCKEE